MHAALWATRYLDITGCDVARDGGPRRPPRPPGPAVARLVPHAVRREHALRPDRPRRPLRHQPRRARTPAPGPVARPSEAASAPGRGRDRLRRQAGARPVLAAAGQRGSFPGRAAGRAGRGGLPGRPPRMRPVPQAPVRPLDPGRLPGVRQHLRGRPVRPLPRRPRRGRRPPRRAAQGRSRRAPCRRSLGSARSIVSPRSSPAASPTPTPAARSPRAPSAGRSCPTTATRASASSTGWRRPTTRTSPAASSTASGPSTSARAWWTRSTTSRSPTRPRTPRCSTPWRPTSSPTATTSAGSSGLILNSRAYQRSSEPVAGNLDDRGNFARSMPRPLMAEVLVDALNAALGRPGRLRPRRPEGGSGHRDRHEPGGVARPRPGLPVFGRPERAAVCDCERPKAPALPQTLFLMTDAALLPSSRPAGSGRWPGRTVATRRRSRNSSSPPCRAPRPGTRPGRPSTTSGRAPTAPRAWPTCSGR